MTLPYANSATKGHEDGCACQDSDAYDCWRARYKLTRNDDVLRDGGPCMCLCHCDDEE